MHYETSKFILSSFTIGRFTHIECLPGDHSEVYNQDVCSTVPSWTLKKSTFRGFWAPNAKKWYKIHTTLHLGLWTYHVYSTWALKMYGYNFSCGLRKTKTLKMAIGPTFCGMGDIFLKGVIRGPDSFFRQEWSGKPSVSALSTWSTSIFLFTRFYFFLH